jgi:hypothetical protein
MMFSFSEELVPVPDLLVLVPFQCINSLGHLVKFYIKNAKSDLNSAARFRTSKERLRNLFSPSISSKGYTFFTTVLVPSKKDLPFSFI